MAAPALARGGRGPWLVDKSREELLQILAENPDPRYRAAAAGRLSQFNDAESARALVQAFDRSAGDSEPTVRSAAADALAQRKENGRYYEIPLFEHLLLVLGDGSEEMRVRAALARSICKYEDRRAVPALLGALKTKDLRAAAAGCLGELKATDAAEPLARLVLRTLESESKSAPMDEFLETNHTVIESAEALGRIGDAKGLPGVLPMLFQEMPYRRQIGIEALGRIGAAKGLPAQVRREVVVPMLLGFTEPANEPKADARIAAVSGLGGIKDKRMVPALLKAFHEDPNYRVRSAAAWELEKLGTGVKQSDVFKDFDQRVQDGTWTTDN